MLEYEDAIEKARRLSVCKESFYSRNDMAASLVTRDDLLIYTRWLICRLHFLKKRHGFLKVKTKSNASRGMIYLVSFLRSENSMCLRSFGTSTFTTS